VAGTRAQNEVVAGNDGLQHADDADPIRTASYKQRDWENTPSAIDSEHDPLHHRDASSS
jgi:hypothetical protein